MSYNNTQLKNLERRVEQLEINHNGLKKETHEVIEELTIAHNDVVSNCDQLIESHNELIKYYTMTTFFTFVIFAIIFIVHFIW